MSVTSKNKSVYFVITLGSLILIACGYANANSRSTPHSKDFKSQYQQMKSLDEKISLGNRIGSIIRQRQNGSVICRMSQTVKPSAGNEFACWQLSAAGAPAETLFNALSAQGIYSVSFESGLKQQVEEAMAADESQFCQETAALGTKGKSIFRCYQKR